MVAKQWLMGTAGALGFAAMVGPAHSDPLASAAGYVHAAGIMAASPAEQVAYRLCTTTIGWLTSFAGSTVASSRRSPSSARSAMRTTCPSERSGHGNCG